MRVNPLKTNDSAKSVDFAPQRFQGLVASTQNAIPLVFGLFGLLRPEANDPTVPRRRASDRRLARVGG
jgi:hypothetical protein